MLDFPVPFSPVIALKYLSKAGMWTRVAYDLKPSMVMSSMYMVESYLRQGVAQAAAAHHLPCSSACRDINCRTGGMSCLGEYHMKGAFGPTGP